MIAVIVCFCAIALFIALSPLIRPVNSLIQEQLTAEQRKENPAP